VEGKLLKMATNIVIHYGAWTLKDNI